MLEAVECRLYRYPNNYPHLGGSFSRALFTHRFSAYVGSDIQQISTSFWIKASFCVGKCKTVFPQIPPLFLVKGGFFRLAIGAAQRRLRQHFLVRKRTSCYPPGCITKCHSPLCSG